MKYYHLAGLKTRLVMAVRFRPQKPMYAIDWHFFYTLDWKQILYFPSCSYRIRFALRKERKGYVGLRTPWEHPCRFDSCI